MVAIRKFLEGLEFSNFRKEANRAPVGSNPCTHCRKKMNVVFHMVGDHNVELDFCKQCSLIWFDTGEWRDIESAHGKLPVKVVDRERTLALARSILSAENEMTRARKTSSFETVESPSTIKTVIGLLGFPVEEDPDAFANKPWITWLLIATCTLVSCVVLMGDSQAVVSRFGFSNTQGFFHRLLTSETSFFLHGSFFHLIGNMYCLWIFGDNVEDELGKRRYLALIAAAALVGSFAFGIFDHRASSTANAVPVIGASGGIAGLVAFYLIRFPHRRFLMRFFFVITIAIPSYLFGIMFFFKDIIATLVQSSGQYTGDGIAHISHLGGAAVGISAAIFMRRKNQSL